LKSVIAHIQAGMCISNIADHNVLLVAKVSLVIAVFWATPVLLK
jgi:hypothetical protein